MQVVYKIDLLFMGIYSFLILAGGMAFSLAAKNAVFIAVTLLAEGIYLFMALRRPAKRYRALKKPLPGQWKQILTACSSFYRNLDKEGKQLFERNVGIFLSDFTVEGLRRQPIDLKTKLLVASGFAALLHGRPDWEPPIKDGVLVYPGERFSKDYQVGKGIRAGQASVNSPLIVTAASLAHSFQNPEDGYNVIYHELAHYFDLEDGQAEGIPTTRLPADQLEHWKTLIRKEWQKAAAGRSFLGTYAGTNEAETFAVAVEVFFENPQLMVEHNPELYRALKDFFNIDTLEIMHP
jgi:Mlc titration factor MtfA (ptsG expression regulator)